ENPSTILNTIDELANQYYEKNKDRLNKTYANFTKKQIQTGLISGIRRAIIGFCRKKFTIEFLFGENFVCPICRKANINSHLTSFVAHHTNLKLIEEIGKIKFGKEYDDKDIEWLIRNIVIQECIFICRNCHAMLHAPNYRENVLIIFESQKKAKFVDNFYENLDNQVEIQRRRIIAWKEDLLNNKFEIPNPF
ncbi:MAG: hypothetical protein ACFFDK_14275, partial [Promethearchaeota archaeon]